MINRVDGLLRHSVRNVYREEEAKFMKMSVNFPSGSPPKGSNIITSHVIYKVEEIDDGSLKMKAKIAPHGNKDKDRDLLKTDSAQFPPTDKRILVSIATIMK